METNHDGEPILCPSAQCKTGAILLGVVQETGSVGFLHDRLIVNKEFVATVNEGRTAEKRFRFAGLCATTSCQQWTGTRCSVLEKVDAQRQYPIQTIDPPMCSIRSQCRWFAQDGTAACATCPEIITDLNVDLQV